MFSFGSKARPAQLAAWKWELGVRRAAFVARDRRVDRERVAVGRVEGEARAVEVDPDRARPQRDPFEDLRQRIGDGGDLGRHRIDRDRDPDRDVAEVVGPGDRREDDERGSAARPCRDRRGRPSPAM